MVKKSAFYRADRSEKTSRLTLVLIVILVFIGGSLSIGTIALDQFSKLRELEKVRQNMLISLNDFDNRRSEIIYGSNIPDAERSKDSAQVEAIKYLVTSAFGNMDDVKNYKELLVSIQKKENYNIHEIAMRIAIAAMTFFLVQVFLHIYKYNQQQSTSLLTKAEVLELFNEQGSDMKKLREILASKIEENPRFGKPPSTPVEQIINIADKKTNGSV